MPPTQPPLYSYPVFLRPASVQQRLDEIDRAGLVETIPNLWQLSLGVFRMVHRMVTRPDTIGLSEGRVRSNVRAKVWRYRPLRFPFLLAQGSIVPWDLSGLLSRPERLIRHLVGTHHDNVQFVYDLEILSATPGGLATLEAEARRIVEHDDAHSRLMRDLVVFEDYHETLLATVVAARRDGVAVPTESIDDPDISFAAYLRWCAEQPATPAATLRAWRDGRFDFDAPIKVRLGPPMATPDDKSAAA